MIRSEPAARYGLPECQDLDRRNDMALGHIIPSVEALARGEHVRLGPYHSLDPGPGPRAVHNLYAPNFKEVGGAYCFWVVRPSVRPSVRLSFRPSVRPFVTLFDAQHNFKTMNASVLKFHIWIPHEKIADTYFFSWQDYAPFLSYGPLKKYGCNLVSKISQKLLKLEPWNLMNRLVVMSRQPD